MENDPVCLEWFLKSGEKIVLTTVKKHADELVTAFLQWCKKPAPFSEDHSNVEIVAGGGVRLVIIFHEVSAVRCSRATEMIPAGKS